MTTHGKSGPLVTVLISTFNRRRFFADALASILGQEYRHLQVIAVNDGGQSVGDIVSAANDERVIHIDRRENRGLAYSFNQALQYAQGKYVAYLGDDDLFYPHHVRRLVETLEGDTDAGVAYSDLYKVFCRVEPDGSRTVLGKSVNISRDFDRFFMLHFNHTLHVCMMHRLDLIAKTGPYNEDIRVLIDWDMTRRLAFFSDFTHIRDITGEYYAAVANSDRISYRMRKDKAEYLRNILAIRAGRPAKPWPMMKDTSIILQPDGMDAAAGQQLRDLWLWTYVPYQVLLPLPAAALDRLDSHMPGLVRVPAESASSAERFDAALARAAGDFVAVVPGGLKIENGWIETAVHALWHDDRPGVGYLAATADEAHWSVVVRREEVLEARRRYPTLGVRASMEACNIRFQTPDPSRRPFQYDEGLQQAKHLEAEGDFVQAAWVYEQMLASQSNVELLRERLAVALAESGGQAASSRAAAMLRTINDARPTPALLLQEARLSRKHSRHDQAAALLEQAQAMMTEG
ncbi:MAG: glycosyltransferase [Phycisphaerae bacterium]|nr:glycosyltransferase [Phycisphaerae bacterium]